ncbi:hypothetical protein C8R47DRAFT_1321447 [Mycena vitilis]|nr:hypothetical protein C8R47DRAFT_1321447 [Mycena vitilis]
MSYARRRRRSSPSGSSEEHALLFGHLSCARIIIIHLVLHSPLDFIARGWDLTIQRPWPPLSLMLLSVLAYTNGPSIDLDSFIQSDEGRLLFSVLAGIQRVDEDYTDVSFDSFRSSMDYFVQLYTCVAIFSRTEPPEDTALILDHAMTSESRAELREPIHATVRDAAENVHNTLARRQDVDTVLTTLDTALRLQLCLSRAYGELIRILHEDLRRQLLDAARTDPKKDAGTSHEMLG